MAQDGNPRRVSIVFPIILIAVGALFLFRNWRPGFNPLPILWTYWPVLGTVQLAFYQWNLLPTTPRIWVGLENFEQLFRLPELGQAVGNTLIYIVGLVPFSVVFPLGVAIVLNEINGRIRTLYRAILFLPVLMAPVVVAIIWRWIMNPAHGF